MANPKKRDRDSDWKSDVHDAVEAALKLHRTKGAGLDSLLKETGVPNVFQSPSSPAPGKKQNQLKNTLIAVAAIVAITVFGVVISVGGNYALDAFLKTGYATQIIVSVACMLVAVGLYVLKSRRRMLYGLLESTLATVAIFATVGAAVSTSAWLPVVTSVYFFGRGIENVMVGWNQFRDAQAGQVAVINEPQPVNPEQRPEDSLRNKPHEVSDRNVPPQPEPSVA